MVDKSKDKGTIVFFNLKMKRRIKESFIFLS
jgi:hypothetical protein